MDSEKVFKESDFKKELDTIKTLLQSLSQGCDIDRNKSQIINLYCNSPLKILRILSYPLIKSLCESDFLSIYSTLLSDLSSNEAEIQLNALKLLYKLPPKEALEILQTKEKELFALISNPEFHYERLLCIHDFLLKNLLKSFSFDENNDLKEIIYVFYLKIAEMVLGNNRDITRNCLEIFLILFENYMDSTCELYAVEYYFDGNGEVSSLLQPLIYKLLNYFLGKFDLIYSKILSYETRLRSHLITFVVIFIEILNKTTGRPVYESQILQRKTYLKLENSELNLQDFIENLLFYQLYDQILKGTHEIDLLLNTNINIFRLLRMIIIEKSPFFHLKHHKKCEFLYNIFLHYSKIIHHLHYKRELNVLILNIASFTSELNISYLINISFKTLEIISNNIQNILTRQLIMLICFNNLFLASIRLLHQKRASPLYALFQQDWFLKKIKENQDSTREEILMTLILITLKYTKNVDIDDEEAKGYLQHLLTEVLDIAYSLIDWNFSTNNEQNPNNNNENLLKTLLFAIDIYLILLKKALEMYSVAVFHNQIFEIVKRLGNKETMFNVKLKAIYLLSQYLEDDKYKSQIEFNSLLNEFRNAVIVPIQNCPFSEKYLLSLPNQLEILNYLNKVEQIFRSIYIFAKKLASNENQLANIVMNLLSDFSKYLEELSKLKGMFLPMVSSVKETIEYLSNCILCEEICDLEQIKISRDWFEQINLDPAPNVKHHNEPRDIINIVYNIFIISVKKEKIVFLNDHIENEKPVRNLKNVISSVKNPSISNHRFRKPVLISGYGDFVQIYASHALYINNSLISINLKVINMTNFILHNLKFKILFNQAAEIFPSDSQPKTLMIEELLASFTKDLVFTLKLNTIEFLKIFFEVIIERDSEEPYVFKTLPYRIGLSNFIIANEIVLISKDMFIDNWYNLRFQTQVKCRILGNAGELIKVLSDKNFALIVLDKERKDKKEEEMSSLGLLGISWDGNNIAIKIMGIDNKVQNMFCFLKIKTNKLGFIEKVKGDIEEFLEDLSDGLMQTLL